MKAIILDIDGVMVTRWSTQQPFSPYQEKYGLPFDPKCVDILNGIIKKTDAEIILSSEWRLRYSDEELNHIFNNNKVLKTPERIPYDFVEAFTNMNRKNIWGYKRSREIEMYIENNPLQAFVILDDLRLSCFPENVIQTNDNTGLTEEHIPLILNCLNS